MWFLLILIIGLLGFGFLVDWWNKKNGLNHYDPEENVKHVSESERAYIESYMHNLRNNHTNGPL
ncbi:hypothetical protein KDN24_03505 [Bacillus sp. Bva_UNVM-123]|uniref:hypothetical protein n=1 Tax=Bacillus sp. Bva_UNVM-123 TaxID=2829798 RepID=UPI00391F56DF